MPSSDCRKKRCTAKHPADNEDLSCTHGWTPSAPSGYPRHLPHQARGQASDEQQAANHGKHGAQPRHPRRAQIPWHISTVHSVSRWEWRVTMKAPSGKVPAGHWSAQPTVMVTA